MRQSYSNQLRMDCVSIENVALNLDCRHEIIPLLAGLQYVYSDVELRQHGNLQGQAPESGINLMLALFGDFRKLRYHGRCWIAFGFHLDA